MENHKQKNPECHCPEALSEDRPKSNMERLRAVVRGLVNNIKGYAKPFGIEPTRRLQVTAQSIRFLAGNGRVDYHRSKNRRHTNEQRDPNDETNYRPNYDNNDKNEPHYYRNKFVHRLW
jgi:hypothetical protein